MRVEVHLAVEASTAHVTPVRVDTRVPLVMLRQTTLPAERLVAPGTMIFARGTVEQSVNVLPELRLLPKWPAQFDSLECKSKSHQQLFFGCDIRSMTLAPVDVARSYPDVINGPKDTPINLEPKFH